MAAQLEKQHCELDYHRNWHLHGREVTLDCKIASGAEGEVWKGRLVGVDSIVAIKRARPAGLDEAAVQPWDEREVYPYMVI